MESLHKLAQSTPGSDERMAAECQSRKAIPTALLCELESVLPSGYQCKVHYTHTPPKPCDPLFSPPVNQEPEKTRLSNHFLTVSTLDENDGAKALGLAIEVLVYTTKPLTTIFVSKADSTGFLAKAKPSPIKSIATAFLRWLTEKERRRAPSRRVVVSLFARAQSQYLFPGSAENPKKHVLDDRQLIKWWARVLDPLFPSSRESSSIDDTSFQGYLTVPGYPSQREISHNFAPPSERSNFSSPRWQAGTPLVSLASTRGIPSDAPPRCLLPRFPDDPKARYMSDLDEESGILDDAHNLASPSKRKRGSGGHWNGVRSLDRFWEAMEFRQECSSGRVVGFLWLVISPKTSEAAVGDSQTTVGSSQTSYPETDTVEGLESERKTPEPRPSASPTKRRRKPLTGPVVARQPRLKMSSSSNLSGMVEPVKLGSDEQSAGLLLNKESYDKAMQTMLHLDFANAEIAAASSKKWVASVTDLYGATGDWGFDVVGEAAVPQAESSAAKEGEPVVNNLSGMVKRKRKAANVVDWDDKPEAAAPAQPTVNVLAASMIRKKAKPPK